MSPWLAIDPSFRNTGWAIMDAKQVYTVGLIETKRDKDLMVFEDNLRCGLKIVDGFLSAYGDTSEQAGDSEALPPVYAEAMGGSKSAKAASMMAMVQGILVGTLGQDYDLTLMLPQTVKKICCGSRSATKEDIKARVMELYPQAQELMVAAGYTQKARQEHIFDAIAIGYAIHRSKQCK